MKLVIGPNLLLEKELGTGSVCPLGPGEKGARAVSAGGGF